MPRYREAPEIREIANDLIPRYHEHLELRADEIRYVFVDKASASAKGCQVFGRARKISGLNCYLSHSSPGDLNDFGDASIPDDMFLVEIAADAWRDLDSSQRVALVDHELCHLWLEYSEFTGEPKRSILPHDVEEFGAVVARHGLWTPNLTSFQEQLALFGAGS